MPTNKELAQLLEVAEKKIMRIERQLLKCKKKNSNGSDLYQFIAFLGFAALAYFMPDSQLTSNWVSGNIYALSAAGVMIIPTAYSVYTKVKSEKK